MDAAGRPFRGGTLASLRLFLDAIKVEHTVFALPSAYLGMVLAERGRPGVLLPSPPRRPRRPPASAVVRDGLLPPPTSRGCCARSRATSPR
jgi:hypothetical protein